MVAVNKCETSSRSRTAARDARTRFSSTSRRLELALPPQPIADVPECDRRPLRIVGYLIEKTIRPSGVGGAVQARHQQEPVVHRGLEPLGIRTPTVDEDVESRLTQLRDRGAGASIAVGIHP